MKLTQREEYESNLPSLEKEKTPNSPFTLFSTWYSEAEKNNVHESNVMVVASVNSGGAPSQRAVLLREIWQQKFVFYTNYQSEKGKNFLTNNNVGLFFYWRQHHRQIRIGGTIEKLPVEKSQKYFASRPLESQISSVLSKQSFPLKSYQEFRQQIDTTLKEMEKAGKTQMPLPKNWGGYAVSANHFEFWQGRPSRVHERITYARQNDANSWAKTNLYP